VVVAHKLVPPTIPPDADQRVMLYGVSWTELEVILAVRGERRSPKIAYLEGTLELMSPSKSHEEIKKLIARLVETYAVEKNIALEGYGSWTLRNAPRERGLEPDECYAVGGRKDHPDIAIEVIWTSGGLDKLEIYRGLNVREVWVWEQSEIVVHELEDGAYMPVPKSKLLPELDLELVASLVGQTQNEALRTFLRVLRS
jgi:Uma2 family endonuclease